ncbi:transforming growth factor-beta-induced protein [Catalinimonas alkaloidigena]|uniref:fasciclin domain-containing protein n=1 Tax=Catalinimonas alkaloidigena TaxID=1075417 RepID=UPI0024073ABE|nr:fasciclin domain-containing protein [Catalinimonas alkaloidigena]MDF9795929.1 transforming growth factor-beta-induced protein [Catalinimonas alkaloidigena]
MKHPFTLRKLHFLFICLLSSSIIFSSCKDDDDGEPPRPDDNLIEVLSNTEGLDSLAALIGTPSSSNPLATRLTTGEYTLFAPNNEAFANLLNTLGLQTMSELRGDILSDVILYHVVANIALNSNELDSTITSLSVSQMSFESEGDSTLINPDTQPFRTVVVNTVAASNGYMHITNQVILPPGVASLAPLFGSLAGLTSTLGDIIGVQNLDGGISTINNVFNSTGLLSTLSGSSPYTVLAPINSAFDDFFFVSNENVSQTANYHVLDGNVDLASAGRTITTLGGQTLYVSNTSDGATYLNGRVTVDFNYPANNGRLVHLGGVLKPAAPLTDMVDYVEALSGSSFTIFRKALEETSFDVGSNRTIFMPTDAAFESAGIITTIDSVEAEAARIDPSVLSSILQKHVVTDGILFTPDFEAGTLTTLNGNLAVTLEGDNGTITLNDNNAATEINANLQFPANNLVENGVVIHVINQVLLP